MSLQLRVTRARTIDYLGRLIIKVPNNTEEVACRLANTVTRNTNVLRDE